MKPNVHRTTRRGQRGFSMLEILVTILILLLGLLGLAGLQARSHTAELESYQRAQALVLASKMVDILRANRHTARCFAVTDPTSGTPFLGTTGSGHSSPISCALGTSAENAMANALFAEWDTDLQGAAEVLSGAQVGAMIGARGCISYDLTTNLLDPVTGATISGTGLFTVAVAWQGLNDTVTPANTCATGFFGSETKRRVVVQTFRFARTQ